MTDPLQDSENPNTSDLMGTDMPAIGAWLDAPPSTNAAFELSQLQNHLASIAPPSATSSQHSRLLDRLFLRSVSVISNALPTLAGATLPIHRKTRQLVRTLQHILEMFAEKLQIEFEFASNQVMNARGTPPEVLLWRRVHVLSQHLHISNLTASPAGKGIWLQLHQSFNRARHLQFTGCIPAGTNRSLQTTYLTSVLLGCAQPATFTSTEISFVGTYLDLFSEYIEAPDYGPTRKTATFWIDPERDEPALACSRKTVPGETPVYHFSCTRLASLLKSQLAALESGKTALQAGLPQFAGTPAGRGVLRRLISHWGRPGKRRFPRRNQSYRATLCTGLDVLWHLFRAQGDATFETSNWMVTNESPDGYALMHVSGKTGPLSVGDVAAIKTDSGENWQTCIVRWAISENQEHLELGLQILSTQAIPALLALPGGTERDKPLPVLVLPQIPSLRPEELLIAPSGTLESQAETFVLLVENGNLSVREVRSSHLEEQNGQIEVFAVEPDTHSG